MKKHLLMLFAAVTVAAMSLNAQTIVIDEGFENGIQDSVWTQEYVSGQTAWAVEDISQGLSYPSTVKQGTKRAYLRNTTGETQGYVTRLVSKVVDLSPRKVYQPQLSFWYANPRWGADRDTLRVLYRNNLNGKWKRLAEFSTAMANWQKVTLELPEVGATYQIAFEGTDNLGRGIVLDSVKLRSAPECTVPTRLMASNKGASRVNLSWSASWDAYYFEVVVSRDTIDPYAIDELDSTLIAYHGMVSGMQQFCDLTLESGEYYYAYVRSICENEISAWSSEGDEKGAYGFRVRAARQVPFTEKFDYPRTQSQDPEWSWANNLGNDVLTPWVNSKVTSKSELAKYSNDTTKALIFSGLNSSNKVVVGSPIEGGKYAYVATPAIADTSNANFSLNQCQVHFWSTVFTYVGRQYGRGIIVGVMDDPDDITTFVPVDTVTVWGNKAFQENIVELSSYTGRGTFIAFLSDFDRQNLFYIDNVTLEYIPEVQKVTKISINPRDTFASISWEGHAAAYNVLITNAEVNPNNPDPEAIVDQATVYTNSYLTTALEPYHGWNNHPYYAYVQAVGADWSYRYPFVTLDTMSTEPYVLDFELKIKRINLFGNDAKYPSLTTTNKFKGSQCLYMDKVAGTDAWITLPQVEDLDSVQIKFFLSGGATTNSYKKAHATIGVMTNPMDINTFTKVSSYTLNSDGYTMCYANFKNYTGPKNGVIAIVWDDVRGMAENTINYIDELRVEHVSDCTPAQDITMDVMADSVTVSWAASQQSQWEVVIVRNSALTATEKDKTFEEISRLGKVVYADTLTWTGDVEEAPVFGIGGLRSQTDHVLYVRTVCGGDAAWWTEMPFSTPCADAAFPYKETFESSSISSYGCWQFADYLGTGYPTISSNRLYLYSYGTTHRSVAILPPIDGNYADMMLSFDAKAYSTTSSALVYVGTMGDINDQYSFVPFDTIRIPADGSTVNARLILSDYTLAYNNIALSSGLGTLEMNSQVYIDNVELKDATCVEPYNFRQTNIQKNSADFVWEGISANDQWELRILNTNVSLANVASGNYDTAHVAIVNDTIITGNAFHVEDLEPISTYYVYIRLLCGDSIWTAYTIQTACEELDPNKPNKETFESYVANSVPQCWTIGARTGTPNVYVTDNSGNKVLHIRQSTSSSPYWAASPAVLCDSLSSMMVSFSWSAYSGETCVFGVMTNPADLSTFVPLDSMNGTGATYMKTATYDLSEFESLIPASAKYLAWRGKYNDDDWVYLDDVSITELRCPLTKPSYSDLTAQSVRISSGLSSDNMWLVLVTREPVSTDSLYSPTYKVPTDIKVAYDTVDVRSKRINGLADQTHYYVYTASLCDSISSQWNSLDFVTPCLAMKPEALGTNGTITFSTSEGYVTGSSADRYLPCWTIGSKTQGLAASSTYIPYIEASSSYQHNGHNSLRIYDYVYGTSSNYVGAYAIMPELHVDSVNKYQVNFWGRGYSASYNRQIIIGVVSDPSDLNTFVSVDTVTMSGTAWEPFSVGLESYEGDFLGNMGKNIMFLSEFGMTNGVYISDVSVELIPTCRPISTFTVDSVGENAARVSWKGYQDTYRLLVADRLLEEYEKPDYRYLIDSMVNASDHVLIENLQAATNYYVYAQGICSESDSTSISMQYAAVRTECPTATGVPLPFFDDFMSYELDAVDPGCWIFRGSSWTKVKQPSSMNYHAIDLYTTSSGNNGYIVLPAVRASLADLQVVFDARTYSTTATATATLYMGTMADPEDPTTFVQAASFALTGPELQHFEVTLGDYDLPYERLVFTSGLQAGSASNDLYITNIGLNMLSACHLPKLKMVSTTSSVVEVEITSDAEECDLVILSETECSKIRDINRYLDTTSTRQRVDTTFFTFSNLQPATSYYIYARSVCGGVLGNSNWTKNPLKIHTSFYFKEDYFFGFEKTELWERSINSTSDNYYIHPALVTGRDTLGAASSSYMYYPYALENTASYGYAHTGTGALSMTSSGNYHGAYVIFPAIDQAKARSFEFKVRSAYISAQTMQPAISSDALLEIGTVDINRSFDTYEPLVKVSVDKLDIKEVADEDNHYLYSYYTLDVDSVTMANKQLVLYTPEQQSTTSYLYFDDVTLGAPKGYSLVALDKVTANGTSALVEWQNVGGPWNLTILDVNGDPVAQYDNLTTTSMLVEGLVPRSEYTAVLAAADADDKTEYVVSSRRSFFTICQALNADANGAFTWDFDDENEYEANDVLAGVEADSLYLKPACFNVGITYAKPVNGYQWLVQRKGYDYYSSAISGASYENYEVGRDNTNALRVYTTATNYNSYIVLPQLNCDMDTMMLEFYGRCFVNYDDEFATESSQGKIVSAAYLSDSYSHSMVVGTLTDPNDFSTLQVLDTLTYSHTNLTTSDNVCDDPSGLRYWQLMQTPLTGAQGTYIVLFQPAPGLFILDDMSVKAIGNTLFAPTQAHTSDITPYTATLTWHVRHPELASVVVVLDAFGEQILCDTVSATTYALANLSAGSGYQWFVYQTDGVHNSPASQTAAFSTECVEIAPAYACGFELTDGWAFIPGQTDSKQTLCWTYGDAIQGEWKNATYDPFNQFNNDNYMYSHADSAAVSMRASYSSYGTSYQPYVAMPAMDITAYDTLQLSFWMRPAYIRRATNKVATTYTGSSYSKSVIVGTMTDPTDAATFMPIDTLTYEGTLASTDEATAANDYLFQQMKVELAGATGPYVAIMTSFYAKGSATRQNSDYVWIDDISFERRHECKAPTALTADRLGAVDATLTWEGGDSVFVLQVSTDQYFAEDTAFVFNQTVDTNPYTVTGLAQQTTYYWRVMAICSGEQGASDFSKKESFTTLRSPYFLEVFNTSVSTNEWTFSSSHADDIVDHNVATSTSDNSYGFKRSTTNYGLQGSHYTSVGYYVDYNWMITPEFYLPENDSVHFSMDLALTACNTSHTATANAVTESDMANDFYFMLIVSDDGGQSWKSENILRKWQNTNPTGQQLRDISSTGQNVRVSLAPYAGKNIRVGLYREAKTSVSTGIAIHVDNVRLAYFDKVIEYASGCQYEDITIGDIHLSGDSTQPGIHIYPESHYASDEAAKAGMKDTVYSLEVEVFEVTETIYDATICEGDTYTDLNFHGKDRTGVYHRKMPSVHGCDSVITLNLTVIPRAYAEDLEVGICPGESYIWHNKTYNRAGIFRDTLTSAAGCDSICTLIVSYLQMEDTIRDAKAILGTDLPYTYVNENYPYAIGQAPIYYPEGTPFGVYVDTVNVQGEQCNTVLILTLTIGWNEAVDQVDAEGRGARKLFIGDRMYILIKDEWYNAAGQKVADPRR